MAHNDTARWLAANQTRRRARWARQLPAINAIRATRHLTPLTLDQLAGPAH